MKMANIGIGVGAFANGLLGGIQAGRQIKQIRNENEIEQIRKDGLKQASQIREAGINSSIRRVPAGEGLPSQYEVGGQTFASRDEARRHAETKAPSKMDAFTELAVPRIREAYLAQGNIEMANYWDDFAKSRQGDRYIKNWARGFMALQSGDFTTASKMAGQLLRQVDPNLELAGADGEMDANGNMVGLNMKVRDRESGHVSDVRLDAESFVQLYNANNPQAFAESMASQMAQATQARLADAQEERKHGRQLQRDTHQHNLNVRRDAFQHEGRVELETIKGQIRDASERRKLDQQMEALRQAGYSDQFVNSVLPSLLGVDSSGPYRKGPSPEETAAQLYNERMRNDYSFAGLSEAERQQRIREDMSAIYNIVESLRDSGVIERPRDSRGRNQQGGAAQEGLPIYTFN